MILSPFFIAVMFQSPLRFGVNKVRLNLHDEAGMAALTMGPIVLPAM